MEKMEPETERTTNIKTNKTNYPKRQFFLKETRPGGGGRGRERETQPGGKRTTGPG